MGLKESVQGLRDEYTATFKKVFDEGKAPDYAKLYKRSIQLNISALEELKENDKEIERLKKEVFHFINMAQGYEKIIQQQQDQIELMK